MHTQYHRWPWTVDQAYVTFVMLDTMIAPERIEYFDRLSETDLAFIGHSDCSIHEMFFATSDILTNIFLINAGHFYTKSDILIVNKAEMFIKAQLKLVKITSKMLSKIFHH